MQQQDYSAPAADCGRFHAHEERRQNRRASSQRSEERRAIPPPIDESLATERPEKLIKIWESWDRRVTEHIARQQGHVQTISYASPTRSSAGKGLASSSTSKSRRKMFLSVLGVNEPVDIAQPNPSTDDMPPPVPLVLPEPTEVLVPYVPEEDGCALLASELPAARVIPQDRLQRLRQKRQERSASMEPPQVLAAVRGTEHRTALEQLAEHWSAVPESGKSEKQLLADETQDNEDEQHAIQPQKQAKNKTVRSKQHISPREKKHLLTKVRSRQSGSAAATASPNRQHHDGQQANTMDSSNEADFASSSCDPSTLNRRAGRANQPRQSAAATEEHFEDDVHADPLADAGNDGDGNEHVYAADVRSSRNVHWDHLHPANTQSTGCEEPMVDPHGSSEHEEESATSDVEEHEEELPADDLEDASSNLDHTPPATKDNEASPTSAERMLEELLDQRSADLTGLTELRTAARQAALFDEEQERILVLYEETDNRMKVAKAFSMVLWELQVMEGEVIEEELLDRIRIVDAESAARVDMTVDAQSFTMTLRAVLSAVEAQEETNRLDIAAFELECRYDFLVCPTLEASCDDRARQMIQQLDAEQNTIIDEMEAMHNDELAAEKEHTRSLVDEYERLVQLVEDNTHTEKEELVRVLYEEKILALQGADELHRREVELQQMTHEDDLSALRQQHTAVLAERRHRLEPATATALAQLRRAAETTTNISLQRYAFLAWKCFAASKQWQKAMYYEQVERASNEECVAQAHRAKCDVFAASAVISDESALRFSLEGLAYRGLLEVFARHIQEIAPRLNALQIEIAPMQAERLLMTADSESLRSRVRELEQLLRKMAHLLRAQKMVSTALASKYDQHQVLDRAQCEDIARLSKQRKGIVEKLSAAVTHQLLQRAFVRWLSLASSEPLARLRKLRQEEVALRHEIKCWREEAAASTSRDPLHPLHTPVALTTHHFVERLRVEKTTPSKQASASPGDQTASKLPLDDTVAALKHLLGKERQTTAGLHDDLMRAKVALHESSDALEESIRHRGALQHLLRGLLEHCAANGLSVPQHLTGNQVAGTDRLKPVEQKPPARRTRPPAANGWTGPSDSCRQSGEERRSVGFSDGAGASDPFEPGLS
jgi:hypothetical protein